VYKTLGRDTAGTADPNPNIPKGYSIPYDIMLSDKSWGKKKERWTCRVIAFVFPCNHYHDGALLSWRWDVVNAFLILLCLHAQLLLYL